jgi:cytochrome c-type biogenesis protein CcmF
MDLSYYFLLAAFLLASFQAIFPVIVIFFGNLNYFKWIKWIAYGQFLLVALAFAGLAVAFLSNNFSLYYVAENSNSQLPLVYRFCAVWGGHEGSILLWVFILNLWTVAVSFFSKKIDTITLTQVIAILGFISAGFLLFLIALSNPFALAPEILLNGRDLNPLLQDPGLVFHPPILYMGYVGFSVAFAFAISALLRNKVDSQWASWVRPWALLAWCFLTWGIISGSWWAYRVLGWGGWWFWDPVENASLLPWLAGTALIHSLLVLAKKALLKAWVCLLAILTFALSLIGTFIVRSGILISVHAFAVDPWRGIFMLLLLGVIVGTALLLYGIRMKNFTEKAHSVHFLSKEMLLISNNILLSISVFTILLGTLYPLIIEGLGLGKLSVGAPYFNWVFTPFALLILFFIGVAFFFSGKNPGKLLVKKICSLLAAALGISILLIAVFTHGLRWTIIVALTLMLWIFLSMLQMLWRYRQQKTPLEKILRAKGAMLLAHLGVMVSAVGILFSSAYSFQRDVGMNVGDIVQFGAYQFKLQGVYPLHGPNYRGAEADLQLLDPPKTHLKPQLRYYPIAAMTLSKPAIDVALWRDLYIVLAEPLQNNVWVFRMYSKPFIRWIWAGGLLMIFGGLYSILRSKISKRLEFRV